LAHTTARQRQILSFAGDGLTDAQIGRKLGLSSATVSKHLSRAYARLGVPNRAAAVRLLLGDAIHSPSGPPTAAGTSIF
jgi:DNA-binding NarL/FixJ family response regulator